MLAEVRNKKAFTIIEVVLVLAVAGLIFLVVFAAIPRLQASRRDNQRKRDAEAMFALVIEYESNSGSVLGTNDFRDAFNSDSGPFYDYIVNEGFTSPSGGDYLYIPSSIQDVDLNHVFYGPERYCNSTNTAVSVATGSSQQYALLMALERGMYCVDNS